MNIRRTSVVAGTGLTALAGIAAVLSSAGLLVADDAGKAGSSVLSLYGVATVVHTGADGAVLGTQQVHNRLLDLGEDFILQQVFRDGSSVADSTQIGAICLSAYEPNLADDSTEALTQGQFDSRHDSAYQRGAGGIDPIQTRVCLTDDSVALSGQEAEVGPLIFTANTSAGFSNWVPGQTVAAIGVCRADSAAAPVADCAAPLFAAVDINNVTLNLDETLTVTYTFDMSSSRT